MNYITYFIVYTMTMIVAINVSYLNFKKKINVSYLFTKEKTKYHPIIVI